MFRMHVAVVRAMMDRPCLVPDQHRNLRVRQPAEARLGDEVTTQTVGCDVIEFQLPTRGLQTLAGRRVVPQLARATR